MELDPAIIRQLALGAIPPGIAGVVALGAIWWDGRGEAPARSRRVWLAAPLALAAIYVPTHGLVFGTLRVPPQQSGEWLPVIAVAVAVAVVLGGWMGIRRAGHETPRSRGATWSFAVVGGAAVLALAGWFASGNLRTLWTGSEALWHVGPFAALALVAALGAHGVAQRRRGPAGALALLVFAAGASQVIVLGFSSLKSSQSAGIWAAMMGGALLVSFFRRGLSLAYGGAILVAVMTMVAAYQGLLFGVSERPWLLLSLIGVAPILAAAGTLWKPAERGVRRRAAELLPAVLMALPLIAGVSTALLATSADQHESEYETEYEYGY